MLAFKYRFHGHGSLRYVYKNGDTLRSHIVTIKYINNPRRKNSRFSVVVSKKIHKKAVGRNRIRRRLYEIIRRHMIDQLPGYDVVMIVASSEIITMPHDELENQIISLVQDIPDYKETE